MPVFLAVNGSFRLKAMTPHRYPAAAPTRKYADGENPERAWTKFGSRDGEGVETACKEIKEEWDGDIEHGPEIVGSDEGLNA